MGKGAPVLPPGNLGNTSPTPLPPTIPPPPTTITHCRPPGETLPERKGKLAFQWEPQVTEEIQDPPCSPSVCAH